MLVSCPSRSQVRNFPASVISCFAVRVALSMLRTGFAVSRSLRRWCQRANCSIGVWISGVRSSVVRRWSSQVSKRARRGSPRLGIMWWWTSISRRCSTLRDGGSASNALCDNCNSRSPIMVSSAAAVGLRIQVRMLSGRGTAASSVTRRLIRRSAGVFGFRTASRSNVSTQRAHCPPRKRSASRPQRSHTRLVVIPAQSRQMSAPAGERPGNSRCSPQNAHVP